jgi:hypothetical protein
MAAHSIGIEKDNLDKFLKKYEFKEVENAVNYIDKQQKNGATITNVGGYLWKLLDNGLIEVEDREEEFNKQKKTIVYEGIMKYKHLPEKDGKFFRLFADLYEDLFINWISKTEFVIYQDGILYLKATSEFFKDWIEANCQHQIKAVATKVYEDFKCFKVVC